MRVMQVLIPDKVDRIASDVLSDNSIGVIQDEGIGIARCSTLAGDKDALIVRSYDLHALELHPSINAIGRAVA